VDLSAGLSDFIEAQKPDGEGYRRVLTEQLIRSAHKAQYAAVALGTVPSDRGPFDFSYLDENDHYRPDSEAAAGFMLVTELRLVRHLRQPPVVGEVIAGIALGPSILGLLPGNPTTHIFPAEARPYLSAIAQVGLLVFMFGIGWEFDKSLLNGRHGAAGAVSIG